MLTIEEIKKELDAGNTVELECIDKHGLKKEHYGYGLLLRLDRFIVSNLNGEDIFFNDSLVGLSENHLKHFRIKRPVPTFDDLVDIAVQAAKDGVIVIRRFHSSFLDFEKFGTTKHADNVEVLDSSDAKDIKDAIEFIESLYTETFVIDSVQFPDLKVGGKFVQNGVEWELNEERVKIIENTPFFLLKGATVTQSRGEK